MILLLILVPALIAASVIAYIYWQRQQNGGKKSSSSASSSSSAYPSAAAATALTVPGQRYVMPMRWHQAWGEWAVNIELGGVKFDVVPDSGSQILVVPGAGCQGCGSAAAVWPQPRQQGQLQTISYGSQSVQFQWTKGTFGEASKGKAASGGPIVFGAMYVASATGGGGVMNVMGLQPSSSSWSRQTLLEQLVSNEGIVDAVTFDYPRKLFALGSYPLPTAAKASTWAPLLSVAEAQKLAGHSVSGVVFYMIDVSRTPALAAAGVRVAIIDTGTTDTLLPSSVDSRALLASPITLAAEGQQLSAWQRDPSAAAAAIQPTDPGFVQQLGPAVMLIGNRWLSGAGYGVQFDNAAQRVIFFS